MAIYDINDSAIDARIKKALKFVIDVEQLENIALLTGIDESRLKQMLEQTEPFYYVERIILANHLLS